MSSLAYGARLLTFAAILVTGGAVVFRWFIAQRSSFGTEYVVDLRRRAATLGVFAALLLIPAACARLVVQVDQMRFPDEPWFPMARAVITTTTWGAAWIAQLALAAALAATFGRARRKSNWAWALAALLALALCATPSFASHAASARRFGTGAVVADVLHIIGAAMWLGTLAALTVAVDGRVTRLVPLVRAFSPIALFGAALVALSGVVSSFAHITTWPEFVGTPYGRMILLKVASVLLVTVFGFVNWRILTPKAGTNPRALGRGVLLELVAAAVVLIVTALLVATPPPVQ